MPKPNMPRAALPREAFTSDQDYRKHIDELLAEYEAQGYIQPKKNIVITPELKERMYREIYKDKYKEFIENERK